MAKNPRNGKHLAGIVGKLGGPPPQKMPGNPKNSFPHAMAEAKHRRRG
jgi:hypothetical protein